MLPKIEQDLRTALKDQRSTEVSTLRLLISELKNAQIAKGGELSEDQVIEVISREAKKRRESIEAYQKGGRQELAEKEEEELAVLEKYLPAQISNEELEKIVENTVAESGVKSLAEMGKVMSAVMAKVKGQADGGRVSELVKQKLGI